MNWASVYCWIVISIGRTVRFPTAPHIFFFQIKSHLTHSYFTFFSVFNLWFSNLQHSCLRHFHSFTMPQRQLQYQRQFIHPGSGFHENEKNGYCVSNFNINFSEMRQETEKWKIIWQKIISSSDTCSLWGNAFAVEARWVWKIGVGSMHRRRQIGGTMETIRRCWIKDPRWKCNWLMGERNFPARKSEAKWTHILLHEKSARMVREKRR